MTDGLEYLGRARMQGLTLLVLAFLVGALAGVAGDRVLSRPRPPQPAPQRPAGGTRLPRVLEDMDLSPAQRAVIDSVLASGRPRNEAIMKDVLPRLRAVGDTLHQGIRAVLTPAQAAEFDAYLKSHRSREMEPPPPREGEGAPDRPGAGPAGGGPPRDGPRDRRPPPRDGIGGPAGGGRGDSVPPDGDLRGRRPPRGEGRGGPPEGGRRDRRPPPPPGGDAPPPPEDRR